ncbi:tRNA (N6-isopentenyl adenosine(37)-C2)-methylthiotransferase MiaB, partial [Dysosmobacter welbionis]
VRMAAAIITPVCRIGSVASAARWDGDGHIVLAVKPRAAPAGEGIAGFGRILEGESPRLDGVGVGIALRSAAGQIIGDRVLGGCRRVLFEDGLDLHVVVRHEELVVLDGHAAADDLPLLEVVALFGHGGQGDLRAGRSGGRSCGAGAVSVIADGDGVGGGGNNAVFPQRLDLCVPAHGIGIAYLVLRAANLPSLELLIGGSGEAADGQDVICLCLDDHGTHAAAAAVAAEGDCAIRKRRTLTHSDFRIGAGKVVVILRIADEVIASGQVINLRAAARRIASFACHTVFHLISHAADFAVAAAHGDGRDTDQAVRSFPRGFADAPRCGHGIGAAVHPFAGLGCDANGVIARVRAGVAGDVHSSEIIAVHGRGMHRAVIGICSRYADVGLCGIGGHGRCVLLEDSLDLHVVVRHEELVVLDGHAAADDLPLLEAVALVGRGGQGDFRAGHGFCMRCGSRSVPVRSHGDGKFGGR